MKRECEKLDFSRFLEAQEPVIQQVYKELRDGRKRTHWMWFIFPQIKGLGRSEMAVEYAIASLEEAKAYLSHSVLGERLRECTSLVNSVEHRPINEIFGYPDDLKFRSSMTLFERAAPTAVESQIFRNALDNFFSGTPDPQTIEILRT